MSSSLGTRVRRSMSSIRRILESYCQDDVNVVREACRVLRQEFIDRKHPGVFRTCHYSLGV